MVEYIKDNLIKAAQYGSLAAVKLGTTFAATFAAVKGMNYFLLNKVGVITEIVTAESIKLGANNVQFLTNATTHLSAGAITGTQYIAALMATAGATFFALREIPALKQSYKVDPDYFMTKLYKDLGKDVEYPKWVQKAMEKEQFKNTNLEQTKFIEKDINLKIGTELKPITIQGVTLSLHDALLFKTGNEVLLKGVCSKTDPSKKMDVYVKINPKTSEIFVRPAKKIENEKQVKKSIEKTKKIEPIKPKHNKGLQMGM